MTSVEPFFSMNKLPTSSYSTLLPYQERQVRDLLPKIIPDAHVIVDATAHIGGDTLMLSKVYPDASLVAIDIDKEAIECLISNIKKYANPERFRVLYGDCVHLLFEKQLFCDVCYFDPPWGGPSYQQKIEMPLILSARLIEDIILEMFKQKLAKHILVKVPKNFTYGEFCTKLEVYDIARYPIFKPQQKGDVSYYLVHIKETIVQQHD